MRRVVITGMGVVSPVGSDVRTFWDNLVSGCSGIGRITRFDTTEYAVKVAAEVKAFDPLVYFSKPELRKTDRNVQYAVAAAAEAVADSGVEGHTEPFRTSVYMGTGIGGMETFEAVHRKLVEKGPHFVSPYFIPMMIANMAAGTIAIRYGWKGAALPSVSACASGGNAIGEALRAIRHGYADVILAGGTEAAITPCGVAGFINMQALAVEEDPALASLPFDKRRKGFVVGEGAAALVLEEYTHAVNRGAKIYAELCGYGSTCDAYHMTAPDPEGEGAMMAIRNAFEESGSFDFDSQLLYINAHGTGTPFNDKSETKAIKRAFGEEAARKLMVSSTKSMTGHMMGAAGAAEAIASVMTLTEGVIPPTIGLLEPDPECDLDYVPLTARTARPDLVISNSLGFGGHNASLAFRTFVE